LDLEGTRAGSSIRHGSGLILRAKRQRRAEEAERDKKTGKGAFHGEKIFQGAISCGVEGLNLAKESKLGGDGKSLHHHAP